jgi:hypothetical protein
MQLEPIKLAKGFHSSMDKSKRYGRIQQLRNSGYRHSPQGVAELVSALWLWAEGVIPDEIAERFIGIGPGTIQTTYDEILGRVSRTFNEKVLNEQE